MIILKTISVAITDINNKWHMKFPYAKIEVNTDTQQTSIFIPKDANGLHNGLYVRVDLPDRNYLSKRIVSKEVKRLFGELYKEEFPNGMKMRLSYCVFCDEAREAMAPWVP